MPIKETKNDAVIDIDGSKEDTKSEGSCGSNSYSGNIDLSVRDISYFKKNFGCFPCVSKYSLNDFTTVYETITHLKSLNNYQKNIVLVRFNRICNFINKEYVLIKWGYTGSKLFVIMTGIIAPALLSINVQTDTFWYGYVYWLVWIIQIMVSLTTAFASFYKWDKKYFIYKAYKTKIEQELWLYLELIGRYGIINQECNYETKHNRTSHKTKLNLFLSRLEILFKRLKDADLDIEITEEDGNQGKEGNNTNVVDVGDNPDDSRTVVDGSYGVNTQTSVASEADISKLLMSEKTYFQPPPKPTRSLSSSTIPLGRTTPSAARNFGGSFGGPVAPTPAPTPRGFFGMPTGPANPGGFINAPTAGGRAPRGTGFAFERMPINSNVSNQHKRSDTPNTLDFVRDEDSDTTLPAIIPDKLNDDSIEDGDSFVADEVDDVKEEKEGDLDEPKKDEEPKTDDVPEV